jgi:hypothetical protein
MNIEKSLTTNKKRIKKRLVQAIFREKIIFSNPKTQ